MKSALWDSFVPGRAYFLQGKIVTKGDALVTKVTEKSKKSQKKTGIIFTHLIFICVKNFKNSRSYWTFKKQRRLIFANLCIIIQKSMEILTVTSL